MTTTKSDPTREKRHGTWRSRLSPLLVFQTSWGLLLLAAVLITLLGCYLTRVAPALVPVDPLVRVPFPPVTRFLEVVCAWTGDHPGTVALVGIGLIAVGVIFRGGRYNFWLVVGASLSLCLAYISISAPIDRLLRKVEEALPEERVVPDFLPGGNVRQENSD